MHRLPVRYGIMWWTGRWGICHLVEPVLGPQASRKKLDNRSEKDFNGALMPKSLLWFRIGCRGGWGLPHTPPTPTPTPTPTPDELLSLWMEIFLKTRTTMGAEKPPPLPCKFLHFLSLINVNQKAEGSRKIIQIFGCVWQPLGTSEGRYIFSPSAIPLPSAASHSPRINIRYNFIGHKANRFGSERSKHRNQYRSIDGRTIVANKSDSNRWAWVRLILANPSRDTA